MRASRAEAEPSESERSWCTATMSLSSFRLPVDMPEDEQSEQGEEQRKAVQVTSFVFPTFPISAVRLARH